MIQSLVFNIIEHHLEQGGRLRLFLDYDGTLVPIARTPDKAQPDAALLDLLTRLAQTQSMHTAIISGRPLTSLQAMLPVLGITLAGSYGIEIQMPGSSRITRVNPKRIRPKIAKIRSAWQQLLAGRSGFLLEDKGLTVALHARFADPHERAAVLPSAEGIARIATHPRDFRILGDVDFLEVAPVLAHKGKTVEWLLDQTKWRNELLVYFGDDDKDEEAFDVVQRKGGYAIQVGNRYHPKHANAYLDSTDSVRQWLDMLVRCAA